MTQERFLAILEAYGAKASHWPAAERAAAQAFLASAGPEVRAAFAREAALDAALASLPPAPVSDLLARRILKGAPAPSRRLRPWTMLAASAVLGVMLGFGGVRMAVWDGDAEDADSALAALLGEYGDEDAG